MELVIPLKIYKKPRISNNIGFHNMIVDTLRQIEFINIKIDRKLLFIVIESIRKDGHKILSYNEDKILLSYCSDEIVKHLKNPDFQNYELIKFDSGTNQCDERMLYCIIKTNYILRK
jgi:hypothetical protein